jgi:hypothetical protein
MHEHPSGVRFLLENVGKDVSSDSFGGVYNHSYGAENLLASMRYAKLTIQNFSKHVKRFLMLQLQSFMFNLPTFITSLTFMSTISK